MFKGRLPREEHLPFLLSLHKERDRFYQYTIYYTRELIRVGEETNEILQRLTRVETKIDLMITARDIAQEALQSTKTAHHRIDSINKIIFWFATTFFGSIIVAIGVFITKGGLGK